MPFLVTMFTNRDGNYPCSRLGLITSLYNHGCEPNIVQNEYDDGIVVRTIKPIREGDQLYVSYFPGITDYL